MTLRRGVRSMILACALSGAVTIAVALIIAPRTGLGPAYELVPLTVFLALSWAFPVLVLRTEETEAFQLDEAFFVPMALLLPPAGTIIAFAAAIVAGNILRRRPFVRAAFNTGQSVTAAGLGIIVMHLAVHIRAGATTPEALGGAVLGGAVFMLANTAAVSFVISLNEGKPALGVLVDGLELRILVWAGGMALGLLAAIGGAAHAWALLLGALPLAALNLVLREHARARRQSQRAQGLLVAAGEMHASVDLLQVEQAVVSSTESLVQCRHARIDQLPAGPGEVGVTIPDQTGRWLIVADPIGFQPFGEPDRELLTVIAQMAARAMQNARLLQEIRHRAIHDPLTDLPNKVLFTDRVVHALAKTGRHRGRLAVMFLDLDQFKVINDSLGHETGDNVLLGVAGRLQTALRPGDTVARVGGDEFAVLCEDLNSIEDAATIGERMRNSAAGSLVANSVKVVVTASVGIVMVDPDWDVSAAQLLQAADTAMYRAKERGRDRVEVFDHKLRDRAVHRLETETTLRRALDDGRLRVFYQPILDVVTGRIVEAEALLRVETPAGALLSPADFIEVAEGSGLIATIGVGVLEEACRQVVTWHKNFGHASPARVAVNLSGRQLSGVPIAETVQRVLASTGCRPDMLALEITETVLMEASEQVRSELATLRDLGVTIGLDDFGTGYSSLAYIKRFPLDFVKIDRCFVSGLGHDPEDEAIVDAIISLARSLGLSSVAEGVETAEQMARLRRLACDRVQGYLFARPQPAHELDLLIAGGLPLAAPAQLAVPPAI